VKGHESSLILDTAPVPAECGTCHWKGTVSELLGVPFKHGFVDGAEAIEAFIRDLRGVLGRDFTPIIGRVLLKWGFLRQPVDGEQLGRYLVRICMAVANAILEERADEERRNRGQSLERAGSRERN
jgi:hypothetical protein